MLQMLNIDILFLMFACDGLFAVSELVDKTIHQMQVPRDEWYEIIASKTGSLLSLVETSEISAKGGYDKIGMELLEDALVRVWKSWVGD